ncbi:MAG: hypothetical protein Kow0037_09910 [Calditrichia bacterium]
MSAWFTREKEIPKQPSRREVQIGNHKIYLNNRGLIPAIIECAAEKGSIVLNLVYLNLDALEMSLSSGELYIFKRSKNRVVKVGEEKQKSVSIDTIMVSKNNRSLLITIPEECCGLVGQHFIDALYPKKYEYRFEEREDS